MEVNSSNSETSNSMTSNSKISNEQIQQSIAGFPINSFLACDPNHKIDSDSFSDLGPVDFRGFQVRVSDDLRTIVDQYLISNLLKKYLKFRDFQFRDQVESQGFRFTVAFDGPGKEIWIFTLRMHRELHLLSVLDRYPETLIQVKAQEKEFIEKYRNKISEIATWRTSSFPSDIEFLENQFELASIEDGVHSDCSSDCRDDYLKLKNELNQKVGVYQRTLFEKISDWGLKLAANYDCVRLHLLKFLAVLPCVSHDKKGDEVKRLLLEAFENLLEADGQARQHGLRGTSRALPRWIRISVIIASFVATWLPAMLVALLARQATRFMAKRFILGETMSASAGGLAELEKSGRYATIDQLGELVVSDSEANLYLERVLATIRSLGKLEKREKLANGISAAHVSIKVSALAGQFKPQSFDYCFSKIAPRLTKILKQAHENGVFVNVDAEHYHYRDMVWQVFREVLVRLKADAPKGDLPACGIVVQAYLKDSLAHFYEVKSFLEDSKISHFPIRLVKGAYWDEETIKARAHSHVSPQFLNKVETDLCFRHLCREILATPQTPLCIASHNLSDHCYAESLRAHKYPDAPVIEHQCLHMTFEALSIGMEKMGWPVRNYVPVGDLLVGMAYLVRRIMENSSQVGVLQQTREIADRASSQPQGPSFHKSVEISSPQLGKIESQTLRGVPQWSYEENVTRVGSDFFSHPPMETYLPEIRSEFQTTLNEVFKQDLPQVELVSVDVAKEKLNQFIEQEDPQETINWRNNSFERHLSLGRLASFLSLRRSHMAAVIMKEAHKTIDEALADVDEAIDFIDFYCRQEFSQSLNHSQAAAEPLGIVGVIAPWNFPLAIACGMSVAPLVTGNRVVLKPAEQTPYVAQLFYEWSIEAGIPKEVFLFLPGEGDIGALIANSEKIQAIAFTGSVEVGTKILKEQQSQVVQTFSGESIPKRVIAEMGGKNALIVTQNCELDETIDGILYSAFAHAGQKCSALSRVLVDKRIQEKFLSRLIEACKEIPVGSARSFETTVNPLISATEKDRVLRQVDEIRQAIQEEKALSGNASKILLDRSREFGGQDNNCEEGDCESLVGPVLVQVSNEMAKDRESFFYRELFAPVLHVYFYSDLNEAVRLFNATDYALTGGIFGQSQKEIDFVSEKLQVGNLYINRTITGARVGIEPFGGFKMSGTGPKAGQREYLCRFQYVPDQDLVGSNSALPTEEERVEFDYIADVPQACRLSFQRRRSFAVKFAGELRGKVETVVGTGSEGIKEALDDAITFLSKSLESKKWIKDNHGIPGQISFNDYTQSKGPILIAGASFVESQMIKTLVLGLASGQGVGVATVTARGYEMWSMVYQLALKNGFSKRVFSLWQANPASLQRVLEGTHMVYLPNQQNLREEILQGSSGPVGNQFQEYFGPGVGEGPLSSERLWEKLHFERSFAVNIMRHGAPLN